MSFFFLTKHAGSIFNKVQVEKKPKNFKCSEHLSDLINAKNEKLSSKMPNITKFPIYIRERNKSCQANGSCGHWKFFLKWKWPIMPNELQDFCFYSQFSVTASKRLLSAIVHIENCMWTSWHVVLFPHLC